MLLTIRVDFCLSCSSSCSEGKNVFKSSFGILKGTISGRYKNLRKIYKYSHRHAKRPKVRHTLLSPGYFVTCDCSAHGCILKSKVANTLME